jgi:type II secretory pathway pseudopilin PulG
VIILSKIKGTYLMKANQKKGRKNAGYTLIETLVSGMLMVFAVTAAVAVVGTGTQLGTSDNDRRQARAIIRSMFEQEYDFRDFNQIPEHDTTVENMQIDERMGNPLVGQLTRFITTGNIVTNSGTSCPVRRVELQVRWANTDGTADSISLTKLVANAQ